MIASTTMSTLPCWTAVKSLRHGQRDEPHVAVGVAEDRLGQLVHEVDLEALDVPRGRVEGAELVGPRIDARDEIALLLDRGHEAAGGHLARRGQRRRRTQARCGVLARQRSARPATEGPSRVGVASAARVSFSAWSEVAPQPASVTASERESEEVAERRSHRYSLILCRRPTSASAAASTVISGIANAKPVERGGGVGRQTARSAPAPR